MLAKLRAAYRIVALRVFCASITSTTPCPRASTAVGSEIEPQRHKQGINVLRGIERDSAVRGGGSAKQAQNSAAHKRYARSRLQGDPDCTKGCQKECPRIEGLGRQVVALRSLSL